MKYGQKVEGQQPETKTRKKLDPRSYCRFLFVRIVEFKVLDKIKRVLRLLPLQRRCAEE